MASWRAWPRPRPPPRRVCSRRGPEAATLHAGSRRHSPAPPPPLPSRLAGNGPRIGPRMTGCACERVHIRPLPVPVRQLGQDTPERARGVAGVLLERHDALQIGAPLRLNAQHTRGSSVWRALAVAPWPFSWRAERAWRGRAEQQVGPSQAAGLRGATKRPSPYNKPPPTVSSSSRVLHSQRTVASTMSRAGAPHLG